MALIYISMTKGRAYCFTLNNWSKEEYQSIKEIPCRYIVIGQEEGAEGTCHLQGYIYFGNPRSFEAIKKLMPRAHIEMAKGTPKQASDYCKKDGEYWEFGELPEQGRRSDVEVVREQLKEGNGMRGVVKMAVSGAQIKIAEQILKYEEPKRNWKPIVEWYYGATGTGKSRRAHEEFEGKDFYRKSTNSGKWFEGYDAHEYVIIDDIDRKSLDYKNLLDLLDRYECRVEMKGGTRQFLARKIIITASEHPSEMFKDENQQGAELLRRIDLILLFGESMIPKVMKPECGNA